MAANNHLPQATEPTSGLPGPVPPAPPGGWPQYRTIIICLLILVFFLYLFAAPGSKPTSKPEVSESAAAAGAPSQSLTSEITIPAPPPPTFPPPEAMVTPGAEKPAPAPPEGKEVPEAKSPPAPETISPPPVAPAPQPHREVRGVAFTRALIKIMDDQVNKSFWGWRPNSLIFGYLHLTDNVNNLQLGVLEVARRTVYVLNENMSRFALTEAQNPYVNTAMNYFMVSPEKYWFPSASGKYREACENLQRYIDDLEKNRSRFYTRVDNLIALMNHFRDLLGSCFHNLIKDTEADGSPVSWFVCDDYFYFSQGVALAMAEILEGVKEDFADQLAKKNSFKLVEDAIHALHTGAHLSPWIITNASKDGILANHRANMATYIGEAEHIISTLVNVLATN